MRTFLSDFKKLPKNNQRWIFIVFIISFVIGIVSPTFIKLLFEIGA